MRASKYLFSTLKETPHHAKIISHQLMLKSGMIRKLSSGIYIWLPTGIRVLNKIKDIIKNEMRKINALEVLMPVVQPKKLWENSGRLSIYGEELFQFYDRRNQKFILGPTNEEVVTNFIRNEINSFKELPLIIYQIQTKFRDEIRPRFGIVRSREFIMKDAYSFHINKHCLEKTYNDFYQSYINIFNKIKIQFRAVNADSGSMGGSISHEFQALSENGEDEIVFSKNTAYASNINTAKSMQSINFLKEKNRIIPNQIKSKKCTKNFNEFKKPIKNFIKTILVRTKINNQPSLAALLIRQEHELNLFKIEEIDIIEKPLSFVNEEEIITLMGVKSKFLGPLGLKIPIFADVSVYYMKDFTIGSNINEKFFINVNWNVDLPIPIIKDIRNITKKDISSDGSKSLEIKKSIEIGHIFQLGKEYSKKMNVLVQEQHNNYKHIHMGCYGIGITRIVASVIEQNYDDNGIIWPDSIAPFQVVILPLNTKNCIKIKEITENLYKILKKEKIDVILYDRNERPGIMFNQIDLIGIPHQIIISPRHINENKVEYRERKNNKSTLIKVKEITYFLKKKLNLI
ncbi:proline--tRNA ligase [Buchnera aphidicola]|jgi:prolyl-tRNA synthetase|uniref:Proline--tRNA ligase n=1 Tax=Buchnera aphidicola subsp. Schizaphis graminum (strain Sg) TaxID=198804 RepID=SYP_BUCAP|nr:proline--tRNA ligase [Buchnera aphidicola]Q8K9S2.1 RecName: Full=Proline--tRNA ligase; AltName: Full=Prolyl-tRNA synthetase; Short=ProRS [Buchnera aphidicola str. Sg (Schizaphis graminum)]AAM67793.1 prolyl-tRNA synthetase [Buchnera aphidicola str. Sg (Schizaphis graminum)]AWI49709.1 proline--tRNA ligase [Buchnera aphidicola (Schizaphis graminum)]